MKKSDAFEMLVQQQMQQRLKAAPPASGGTKPAAEAEQIAVQEGWVDAMRLLMRIGANARYFTDSSTKIAIPCAREIATFRRWRL